MLSVFLLLSLVTPLPVPIDTLPTLVPPAADSMTLRPVPIGSDSLIGSPRRVVARWTPRDTATQRPRAVEYSDWYGRRLTIHKIGSWVELPLFAAQYVVGQRLIDGTNVPSWVRPAHGALATGVATLFAVNTVTGVWNLWDARHDPAGRPRRLVHAALLMASDAGFVLTGLSAEDDAEESSSVSTRHRSIALGSMAIATAGTALMWLWKD